MKKIYLLILLTLITISCSKNQDSQNAASVPKSWYDVTKVYADDADLELTKEDEKKLADAIDTILIADSNAVEEGEKEALEALTLVQSNPSVNANLAENKPKDWVPWRAEYFMTDLSLTGGGKLGALSGKGTATIRGYWRKQGPEKLNIQNENSTNEITGESEEGRNADVVINEETTEDEIVTQLNPAIKAAVATGKVKDTPVLRENLLHAARDFKAIALGLSTTDQDLPWWVSRFRLDFTVDVAGRIEPIGLIGGETRFRFEWHRIKRKSLSLTPNVSSFSARELLVSKNLNDFIVNTSYDLEEAFSGHEKHGLLAHQMRIGLGISIKGNIGVVKGSAGIVGQIYFTRNVDRPIVRPSKLVESELDDSFFVIERNPSKENLELAKASSIEVESNSFSGESTFEEAVYKVGRKNFQKSLKKAAKISNFFAKRAKKANFKSWRLYELRTAFDTSLGGTLGLATLTGSVTAQISFFNQGF